MKMPLATYRFQLNKDFEFDDVGALTGYLESLGISHAYLSPVMTAAPGSNHGYDICDFSRISDERGGKATFDALAEKLSAPESPLRLLLDIVPNHMGVSSVNPYWNDVLRKGHQSQYWPLFDFKLGDREKIRLPVLGGPRAEALDKKEITVGENDGGEPVLKYADKIFPLNDATPKDDAVPAILDRQYYDLVPWTEVFRHVTYRRFFNITDLIGVRVEDETVFRETHAALFEILRRFPGIEGVRVDHIDGLADPDTYLKRLSHDTPAIWVEKIVARGEKMPTDWPVNGTTGYEFIDRMNQAFIHPQNFARIEEDWRTHIEGRWPDFDTCVAVSKAQALDELFPAELNRIAALSIDGTDTTHAQARTFWSGLTVALPIYRTYAAGGLLRDEDRSWIKAAAEKAHLLFGAAYADAEKKIMPCLLSPRTAKQKQAVTEWQQLSGSVMAKGMEDSAHYRYTPLAALNEVGCTVGVGAHGREDFFAWAQERAEKEPAALNATSTHDTKRLEDARHRLYALADRPEDWFSFYERAARLQPQGQPLRPATEYFLYQALLCTWPFDNHIDDAYIGRIIEYMRKAAREAGQDTGWRNPSKAYEDAMENFIRHSLADEKFLALIGAFAAPLAFHGAINSLSVQTLKILSPGVPDIYQGTELWNFSLVDPDNRRPVDFHMRAEILSATEKLERAVLLRKLSVSWRDGAIKLWLTQTLLRIRRDYIPSGLCRLTPLETRGACAENLIAYTLRENGNPRGLAVILPRYPGMFQSSQNSLGIDPANWEDTRIVMPAHKIRNLITEEGLSPVDAGNPARLLAGFPVAILAFA